MSELQSERRTNRQTSTVKEAAERLGINVDTAYKCAADGSLPGVLRVGRRYLVRTSVLDELLGPLNVIQFPTGDSPTDLTAA